jgi:hypothetical protein
MLQACSDDLESRIDDKVEAKLLDDGRRLGRDRRGRVSIA